MNTSRYIIDESGNKVAIILPINEYNIMLSDLDDLEDIRLYDSIKSKNEDSLSANEVFESIEKFGDSSLMYQF